MTSDDVGDSVTMKRIAQRAGVSVTTVSRMLTMPEKVALVTQQRIQQAMCELGCNAYELTRQIKSTQANLLLLILSDVSDPRWRQIIRGIERQTAEAGYLLLMIECPQLSSTEWLIESILSCNVAGLFVVDSQLLTILTAKLPSMLLVQLAGLMA